MRKLKPFFLRAMLTAALTIGAATHLQAAPVVLANGNVLDVEHRTVRSNYSVLIDEGKIVQVAPAGKLKTPAGARIIDCRGKWIMPGMVDAHIHLFQSGGVYTRPDVIDLRKFRPYEQERKWVRDNAGDLLARYLAVGVTTVIDVGGPFADYAIRDRFNKEAASPTILLTGPLISTYQPEAFRIDDAPILQTDTPEAARELVRRQLPYKPDLIKVWYIVKPDSPAEKTLPIVQAAIDETHANGLKLAVHATQLNTAKLALKAGADILVHSVGDEPVDAEFIALLKKRQVPYIPTLVVSRRYGEALTQNFKPSAHDQAFANPFALGSLGDLKHLATQGVQVPTRYQPSTAGEQLRLKNLKAVNDAGALVATGTDAGNIGTQHASSYLDELLDMQKAGLSSWDIIVASTLNGAKVLDKQKEVGAVKAGMRADLLVLDSDPVADIRNTTAVRLVINRGQAFEPAALIDSSPVAIVQRQLNAYNNRDVEGFLETYSDDAVLFNFPAEVRTSGKDKLRERYTEMFAKTPELHCEILERMVLGNTVIDHERITGKAGGTVEAIGIYKIANNKIVEVRFIQQNR